MCQVAIRFRKCPECGGKMSVRRSSKGRFWGCEGYPDCRQTIEYQNRPRAGIDIEVKEIDNGYVIIATQKYAEQPEDEDSREIYCADLETLRAELNSVWSDQADLLVDRLKVSYDFVDETPPEKKKKRVETIKQSRNISDVRALMEKVKKSKIDAENKS